MRTFGLLVWCLSFLQAAAYYVSPVRRLSVKGQGGNLFRASSRLQCASAGSSVGDGEEDEAIVLPEYGEIKGIKAYSVIEYLGDTIIPSSSTRYALLAGLQNRIPSDLITEALAGMVVALATIPTSVAYSTIIGLSPLVGIWSSAIVGFFVSILGRGPGLIAGAAGVIAIPMSVIVQQHGIAFMSASILLASVMEMIFGLLKFGKFGALVTEPVVAGFMNAFAVFLFKSQLKVFMPHHVWLPAPQLQAALGTAALCAGVINVVPKFTTIIPASLAGLLVASFFAVVLKLPVTSLSEFAGAETFRGGLSALPVFVGLPKAIPFTFNAFQTICTAASGVAVISVLETLLAQRIASNKYKQRVPSFVPNLDRGVTGLAVGNAVSALFGGFGGCGLIPNTVLNGKSGGSGRTSSLCYSLSLAASVLFLAPVIGTMPLAALAGLMMSVAWNTIEWKETKHVLAFATKANASTKSRLEALALIVTSLVCYKVDMGLGVFLGVLISKAQILLRFLFPRREEYNL